MSNDYKPLSKNEGIIFGRLPSLQSLRILFDSCFLGNRQSKSCPIDIPSPFSYSGHQTVMQQAAEWHGHLTVPCGLQGKGNILKSKRQFKASRLILLLGNHATIVLIDGTCKQRLTKQLSNLGTLNPILLS